MMTETEQRSPTREEGTSRRLLSSDLFCGSSRRVIIRHDGRDYVLIITKRGKLVLNLLG